LQVTDHVPLGLFQVGQGAGFCNEFLDPIFAENSKPCCVSLADTLDREGLAHGHQGDLSGVSSGTAGCGCDPPAYIRNIFDDGHGKQ